MKKRSSASAKAERDWRDARVPPVAWLAAVVALLVAAAGATPAAAQTAELTDRSALRVCADPANIPFSSQSGVGFENEVAELLGEKLDLPVIYTWFPQATGFIRNTLRAHKCDIVMGYAQGHELVQNTNHYYRSAYAAVIDPEGPLAGLESLDDPRLAEARIGVTAGTPPASILALNALLPQVKPYRLMVDRRFESPAEEMIADLESGEIDIALLWGPIAGYYSKNADKPLEVIPLVKETKGPRMAYRITFGIRPGEPDWKHLLNDLIAENQAEIDAILLKYGVPILDEQDHLITH